MKEQKLYLAMVAVAALLALVSLVQTQASSQQIAAEGPAPAAGEIAEEEVRRDAGAFIEAFYDTRRGAEGYRRALAALCLPPLAEEVERVLATDGAWPTDYGEVNGLLADAAFMLQRAADPQVAVEAMDIVVTGGEATCLARVAGQYAQAPFRYGLAISMRRQPDGAWKVYDIDRR